MRIRSALRLSIVSVALGAMAVGLVGVTQAGAAGTPFVKGDVLAGIGNGHIKEYSPTGTLVRTLDTGTGCGEDLGMAFDATGGLLATASFGACGTGHVVHFDNKGNLLGAFGSGYSASTESITVDKSGNVYVGQPDGTTAVLKFDKTGTPLGSFTPTVDRGTDWIDLAADDCTLFYASEGTTIRRFNVCTNKQLADFATGLEGDCFAVRIRLNREVMVACSNKVYRLNSSGGVIQTYPKPSGENSFLFALNLDPDNKTFWTAGYNTANVYRFNIATGAQVGTFTAAKDGCCLSGLAVVGEIRVAAPSTTTTTSTRPTSTTTTTEVVKAAAATTTTQTVAPAAELPRTGSNSSTGTAIGIAFIVIGGALTLTLSKRRRAGTT